MLNKEITRQKHQPGHKSHFVYLVQTRSLKAEKICKYKNQCNRLFVIDRTHYVPPLNGTNWYQFMYYKTI